jgi:hypothetical protein
MPRQYTLHDMPHQLEARCIFCGAVWLHGEHSIKGADIDLPAHDRTKEGKSGPCPGSGYTVKLRYPAKAIEATEDQTPAPKGSDPFPFGIHKGAGKTYDQVPAQYYDWLIGQPWAKRWPQVLAYIKANQSAIYKDL